MLFFCFCFSLKQTFIRLTHQMMTFPVWQAGVFIRSMVGMQQPPFKKTKNKQKINPKVNLLQHIPEWQIIIYTCVLQSQSIDHFFPTLSLQVRSCWALWIQSTTVGGGGNHGSGKSLKYSRYWFTDLSEIQSKLVFQCKLFCGSWSEPIRLLWKCCCCSVSLWLTLTKKTETGDAP